jgi:hypothetical protein
MIWASACSRYFLFGGNRESTYRAPPLNFICDIPAPSSRPTTDLWHQWEFLWCEMARPSYFNPLEIHWQLSSELAWSACRLSSKWEYLLRGTCTWQQAISRQQSNISEDRLQWESKPWNEDSLKARRSRGNVWELPWRQYSNPYSHVTSNTELDWSELPI